MISWPLFLVAAKKKGMLTFSIALVVSSVLSHAFSGTHSLQSGVSLRPCYSSCSLSHCAKSHEVCSGSRRPHSLDCSRDALSQVRTIPLSRRQSLSPQRSEFSHLSEALKIEVSGSATSFPATIQLQQHFASLLQYLPARELRLMAFAEIGSTHRVCRYGRPFDHVILTRSPGWELINVVRATTTPLAC
jgi:hypothetical protein